MTQHSSRRRILLVEDDFVLRTALAQLFETQGYVVDCAANGHEALHRLTSSAVKPAVIVLDLMMPYMGGVEFRTMQRSLPSFASVPVVVITADGQAAREADHLEVDKLLRKPVDTWRLLEAVRTLTASSAS